MNREGILHKVRTALGRSVGDPAPPPPPLSLSTPAADLDEFTRGAEMLGMTVSVVASPEEAHLKVRSLLAGRTAVAPEDEFLTTCGIGGIAGVQKGITDPAAWRQACARADVGITTADYALAATATLVMIASPENPRLVSLLPPEHIAVVPLSRLLGNLAELLERENAVFERSSSLVLITGSSATGDIEQLHIKGVHGPRQVQIVFVKGL